MLSIFKSGVFILIDARRGLKDSDHDLMILLNIIAINFQCILTKIDKISEKELKDVYTKTIQQTANYAASFPEIIKTSSTAKRIFSYLGRCNPYLRMFKLKKISNNF